MLHNNNPNLNILLMVFYSFSSGEVGTQFSLFSGGIHELNQISQSPPKFLAFLEEQPTF